MKMKLIITHHAPDIDAITSVWILKRFAHQQYADAKVSFVDAGSTIKPEEAERLGVTNPDDIVHVDTGEGELDHHQTDRGLKRLSASKLTFDFVAKSQPELEKDWSLQQIVEYTLMDDHFEDYYWPDAANERYLFTLRGILHGLESSQLNDDDAQLNFGMRCLDGIYASLKERKNAMETLDEKGVEFKTTWGKSVGFESSNRSVLRYAQLKGYVLVIVKDPKRGNASIKAAPIPEIDLTMLYNKIKEKDTTGTWFFHKGRHMVLNGSSRHHNDTPTPLSLDQLIEIAKSCGK